MSCSVHHAPNPDWGNMLELGPEVDPLFMKLLSTSIGGFDLLVNKANLVPMTGNIEIVCKWVAYHRFWKKVSNKFSVEVVNNDCPFSIYSDSSLPVSVNTTYSFLPG